jgi:ankyrin repeat protein
MVEYLMANGADPNLQNATGFTGLLHACQRNETKIAKLLLAHNADPNLRNIAGYTALVWASINQNMELVTELLHHSADPNVPVLTNSRYTALTWAMIKSNIDVTKKLLYHGADPYLQVNDGKTSFDYLNDSQRGEVISYFDRCTRWYRRKSDSYDSNQ